MTRLLGPIFLLVALSFMAEAKAGKEVSRESLRSRIEKACVKNLKEDHSQPAPICACVSRNLDAKLDLEKLELITRSHEEDPAAEAKLQEEEYNDLVLQDYDITETCMEKPDWNG